MPWLYSKDTATFITYDDEKSIRLKSEFVKDLDLGGAMFWEFASDRNHDLLDSVYDTFKKR